VDRVAIVLVIFRRIDPALGRDAMSAARAILITKTRDVVTLLGQARRRRGAGQAAANDDDRVFAPVGGVDEFGVILVLGPFLGQRPVRDPGVGSLILTRRGSHDVVI